MPKLEILCVNGRCMEIDSSVDAYTKAETDALLEDKVDKIADKGLSSHDYTTADKNKLAGIEEGAEVNVQSDWNVTNTSSDAYIKNKPGNATSTKDGFMSAADKAKLNTVEEGAEKNVQSDWNQADSAKDDFIKNKPTNATQSKDGFLSKEDKKKIDELTITYYTKTEVDTIIDDLEFGIMKVVDVLPATGEEHIIYLVPKPAPETGFNEYIWVADNSSYELIGDTNVDLSDYYTKTETDTLLNNKVDKVAGKGLSTNDYTTAEKNKLAGIEAGAEVNVQADWNQTDSTKDSFIKNKPGKASTTADGLMSKEDKTKLDRIDWSKEGILQLLGLEEILLAITGKDGTVESKTIFAKKPQVPYACFDSATGELFFFNDDPGKYAEGDVEGTRTYYLNSLQNHSDKGWNPAVVESVTFREKVSAMNCKNWFANASITGIPTLTNLDTEGVSDMSGMFWNCTSLTTLDISSFDVSNVSLVDNIFYGDSALTTIFASGSFNYGLISGFPLMFDGCTSLVGGQGTTFNATYTSKGRAKIDGGTASPGYFTAKP